jgi:hypothetical protein
MGWHPALPVVLEENNSTHGLSLNQKDVRRDGVLPYERPTAKAS